MAPIEPYPSQNFKQNSSNETIDIQLARMATDDDPETFNDDFDDNNHDMNL